MKRFKRLLSAGLVLTMGLSLLSGCSGGGGSDDKNPSGSSGEKGRYVESDYGWPKSTEEDSWSYMQDLEMLSDGSLRAMFSDNSELGFSLMDSADGGKTWTASDLDLSAIASLKPEGDDVYGNIYSSSMDKDGDLFFLHNISKNKIEGNMSITDETMAFYLLTKDGKLTEIPLEIPDVKMTNHYEWEMTEDEIDSDAAEAEADDGGVAVSDVSGEAVPETEDDGVVINEGGEDADGDENYNGIQKIILIDSSSAFIMDYNGVIYSVSLPDGKIQNTLDSLDYVNDIVMCGDNLLAYNWDNVIELDPSTGKQIGEHPELAKIMQTTSGNFVIGQSARDDGLLYYACMAGIYSYNLKDKTTEQIVDGNLSSLNVPNSSYEHLFAKADGDFLISYRDYSTDDSTETLLNYTYDPDMAKVPDKSLRVYSLSEDWNIRSAIAMYQKSHPDTYVKYEYGMTGDDAVTTSDAIRTLNTEIMAGEGPDIIFLDGMPIDSYVEKGLLADISDVTSQLISDGKLFETVANTYKSDDGKLCAIPMNFTVPVVIGTKDTLDKLNSLSDAADLAEQYASGDKKGAFTNTWSVISLIGDFMPTNSASWFKEDGSLDSDSLKAYLTDMKRLFDASVKSLSEEEQQQINEMKQYYTEDIDVRYFSSGDPSWNALYVMSGANAVAIGSMQGAESFQYLSSARRKNPDITFKLLPGALEDVYTTSRVIGVNSKSKDVDLGKDFLSYLLGVDGQKALGDYGGFPVNIEAFDASTVCPYLGEEWYEPGKSYSATSIEDENGKDITLELFWPEEEEYAELKDMINQLKNPSYDDTTILSTILNDCLGCVIGDEDIDAAVDQVVKDINIYLSE